MRLYVMCIYIIIREFLRCSQVFKYRYVNTYISIEYLKKNTFARTINYKLFFYERECRRLAVHYCVHFLFVLY